jgi:hypothetical protein
VVVERERKRRSAARDTEARFGRTDNRMVWIYVANEGILFSFENVKRLVYSSRSRMMFYTKEFSDFRRPNLSAQ